MAKFYDKHKVAQNLKLEDEHTESAFASWIDSMLNDAKSGCYALHESWKRQLAMYEGVPKKVTRDVPIENAPNIEVTIGAIAADTINAQAIDLIEGTKPFATVRPKPKDKDAKEIVNAAAGLQTFVNHLSVLPDVDYLPALETSIMDDIQLGTGMLYVPWVENVLKTKTARILSRGPRVRSIAPEDIIVPPGVRGQIDDMSIFGFQFYYTQQELNRLAKMNRVNIEGFQPMGYRNTVRDRREQLGRHPEGTMTRGEIYDVQLLFIYYDIDGDGFEEDLMVIYNHSGASIGLCTYNPMDRRPATHMVYQLRPHMFFGLGVLGMLDPFEEKLSDLHNYATLNTILANSRVWVGDASAPSKLKIWPGRVITKLADAQKSLQALTMADVYSSIYQDQMAVMQFANNRVGLNDVVSPGNVPNRTPAHTTMSMLQQVNRRFTPAFNSMRNCAASALTQCLYRYQERIMAGDDHAIADIYKVLGYDSGSLVLDILQNEDFGEFVDVELTAASASTNREADQQNSVMLTNLLGQYYQRTLELAALSANPQTPPQVREVAIKIAEAAGIAIERTMRTFDQVRDPQTFVIDVENELKQLGQDVPVAQEVLMQLVGGLAQQGMEQPELPERTMG
jgi:hypothetical protein